MEPKRSRCAQGEEQFLALRVLAIFFLRRGARRYEEGFGELCRLFWCSPQKKRKRPDHLICLSHNAHSAEIQQTTPWPPTVLIVPCVESIMVPWLRAVNVTWETQRRSRLEIESGGVWVRVPNQNCLSARRSHSPPQISPSPSRYAASPRHVKPSTPKGRSYSHRLERRDGTDRLPYPRASSAGTGRTGGRQLRRRNRRGRRRR